MRFKAKRGIRRAYKIIYHGWRPELLSLVAITAITVSSDPPHGSADQNNPAQPATHQNKPTNTNNWLTNDPSQSRNANHEPTSDHDPSAGAPIATSQRSTLGPSDARSRDAPGVLQVTRLTASIQDRIMILVGNKKFFTSLCLLQHKAPSLAHHARARRRAYQLSRVCLGMCDGCGCCSARRSS